MSVSAEELHSGPLKVGLLGDLHWRASSRATDVPGPTTTKANLDVFAKDMNSWGADLVVSMGDFADAEGVIPTT